jgi:hypothetical protein
MKQDPQTTQSRGVDAFVAAYDKVVRDPRARRELIWLRAKEKDDDESVRSLERADPGLRARMRPLEETLSPHEFEISHGRREAYGRLFDQLFEHYASELATSEMPGPPAPSRGRATRAGWLVPTASSWTRRRATPTGCPARTPSGLRRCGSFPRAREPAQTLRVSSTSPAATRRVFAGPRGGTWQAAATDGHRHLVRASAFLPRHR